MVRTEVDLTHGAIKRRRDALEETPLPSKTIQERRVDFFTRLHGVCLEVFVDERTLMDMRYWGDISPAKKIHYTHLSRDPMPCLPDRHGYFWGRRGGLYMALRVETNEKALKPLDWYKPMQKLVEWDPLDAMECLEDDFGDVLVAPPYPEEHSHGARLEVPVGDMLGHVPPLDEVTDKEVYELF